MPGANESSTDEWQSAQVTPTLVSWPACVDRPLHTDDGIQAQQFDRHRRIRQINLARAKRRDDVRRQRVDIDLEPDRQRGRRIDRRDDLVHAQHVGPELLVAKGVEAEDRLPVLVTRGTLRLRRGHGLLCRVAGDRRWRTPA